MSNSLKVPVNRIIPFSSVDGPGNRTAVFLQGCGFDCNYCHNPETRNLCIACGKCVQECPAGALTLVDGKVLFDYNKCCKCDTCIKVCEHGASPRIRWMEPAEVLEEVKSNMPFIRGVTTSGGECTTYPEFLKEFFRLCKDIGLTTLIDSNGSYDFSKDSELLNVTDGVMLDIKAYDLNEHINVTGTDNKMVLQNMEYLASVDKLFEVRTVVVPGLFDYEGTIAEVSNKLSAYKTNIRYKIIAFRPNGVRQEYRNYNSPDRAELDRLAEIAKSKGIKDINII